MSEMSALNQAKSKLIEASGLTELKPGPLPIIPKVLWAEIQEWMRAWKHAAALKAEGLMAPGALLLYGPTGSGKTSLAQGILKHMGIKSGVIMEAHNVLTSAFGGSAQNIAIGFKAAEATRSLLVIEEIDALGISRYGNNASSCATEENKITIALMRHLEATTVPVIATTNFHDSLDPALLRRFELQLEVPSADEKCRAIILRKILGGVEPPAELVALPLVQSIRLAHRMRRQAFIDEREAKGHG